MNARVEEGSWKKGRWTKQCRACGCLWVCVCLNRNLLTAISTTNSMKKIPLNRYANGLQASVRHREDKPYEASKQLVGRDCICTIRGVAERLSSTTYNQRSGASGATIPKYTTAKYTMNPHATSCAGCNLPSHPFPLRNILQRTSPQILSG